MEWTLLLAAIAAGATPPTSARVQGAATVTILSGVIAGADRPFPARGHASQLGCDPSAMSGSCRPLILIEFE